MAEQRKDPGLGVVARFILCDNDQICIVFDDIGSDAAEQRGGGSATRDRRDRLNGQIEELDLSELELADIGLNLVARLRTLHSAEKTC